MKPICFFALAFFVVLSADAQFYYKDIVATQDLGKKQQAYRKNQVKAVEYASFDANNQPIEGFSCQQVVSSDFSSVNTITKTSLTGASENTTWYNRQGLLMRSIDTADGNKTTVDYTYDAANRVTVINRVSVSPGAARDMEKHTWTYNAQGKPVSGLKIKNDTDTTFITIVLDENGNVAEEQSKRKNAALPTIYYYYDEDKMITDIVRYNARAKKLLPDYIFEYEENRVASMLVAEEGTSDYQKWYYSYDDNGLKLQDACYSKAKTLIGRIEYTYKY